MKKNLYAIFLMMFLIAGCRSNQPIVNQPIDPMIFDAAHNSKNSLDWEGVYTGIIPSASGPGIYVRLNLNYDGSYELRYHYLDRDEFTETGTFTWDNTGNIIMLDVKDAPPYYRVGEGHLIQLDMSGKIITGNLADNYILRKTP